MIRAAAVVTTAAALLLPGPAGAVPSGRADYRAPGDYPTEVAALAASFPDRVRIVSIGTSVQGRPIAGVEIADGVARTGDGRPVHVELGLTHGREWTSGETVMEFARELATSDEPRLARLRARSRTFLFPVVNPDGFAISRTTLPAQRKNAAGVDLNRNFGAYWGGPGASEDPLSELYRGPAPFSEPESEALRAWSSAHQVMVVNSLHSYGGSVLHQPGFAAAGELPGARRFAAVGARMAEAAGYVSQPAHSLGDITGAAEDWNFYNQFAFAYTTEIGVRDHQVPYAEFDPHYPGLRAAMVIAGEAALERDNHAVLRGRAPAGRTLRLSRTVRSPTSVGPALMERLATTLTVPASGRFRWHVNPSVRPLAPRPEAWRLRCGDRTRRVVLRLGQARRLRVAC